MYRSIIASDPCALPYYFQPGDRVGTDCGTYRHVGTVSERRWIYANSRKFGKLCEVPPHEFSGGRTIENESFLGIRTRHDVLSHLRQKLGTRYILFTENCEHTNNEAHGLGKWSPQIEDFKTALLGISLVVLLGVVARR